MTRLTTKIVAGIAAIALVGSMSACAARPSTAATVGPERITVGEVDELIAGLPDELRDETIVGHPSVVLNIRMRAVAAQQVAEQRGINDLYALASQNVAQIDLPDEFRTDPEVRTLLISQEETNALREQIGTREMEEAFARIPVTVNPRYGMTGLEELQTLRNTSLSKPAGQPEM